MVFIRQLHLWQVSVKKALLIQEKLRENIASPLPSPHSWGEGRVAGVDVGFSGDLLTAAVCVFKFPKLDLIEVKTATLKASFPYVPGLLAFREGPVILKAFGEIRNIPDVILFDGQGICHPRRMGIATHLGIILDIPSIGCAKSHLYGIYEMPDEERGSFSFVYDKESSERLGAVLRTRTNVNPIFVSPGHKMGIKNSIDLVLRLCPRFRIPEPLRYAHRVSKGEI